MANRAGAMATIDTALTQAHAGPNQGKVHTGPATETGPLAPPPELSPGSSNPYAEKKLTPEEKRAEAEAKRIREHQEALLGKEQAQASEEAREKEEARKKSLLGLGDKVLEEAGKGKEAAQVKIASVPTPGDIWFPLILLLLFFFILILYNGHTRLQWLWLVLTGNAGVGQNPGGSSSGNFGTNGNGSVPPGGSSSGNFGGSGEISTTQSGDTGHASLGSVSPSGMYGDFA
jgi:hypothetical protein